MHLTPERRRNLVNRLSLSAATAAMTVVALLGSIVPAGASSVPSIGGRGAAVRPEPVGLWQPGNSGVYSLPGVTTAYDIQYYGWYEGFQTATAQADYDAGGETFVELQTCGNPCGATPIPLVNVTAGKYDAYLTGFANSVKAFGRPVLITFDHEMNGSWYNWGYGGSEGVTPTQWIAAWDHVTGLIGSIAPNATFVWAPNIEAGAVSFAQYWPGSANVGAVGLDGYYGSTWANWSNSFAKSVADLQALNTVGMPFIVAETGIPNTDASAVAQIDDLFAGARSAGAAGICYFDSGKWGFTPAMQTEFVNDANG